MKYIPKIDGCRAFAVLAVLMSHYFPEGYISHDLPFGIWGVQLFFVISGYLITGILIDSKIKRASTSSKSTIWKVFYMRRILRIFPPYYLLLVVYILGNVDYPNGSLWTCLSYLFNFHQIVDPGEYHYLGHLWTLCIEEQFYLVWPWVIILFPNRKLVALTIAFFLLSPISRGLLSAFDVPYTAIRNLPTSQLDSLCGGAMLVLFQRGFSPEIYRLWKKCLPITSAVGLAFSILPLIFDTFGFLKPTITLLGPAILSMVIIDIVSSDHFSKLTSFLKFKPLILVGRISYGIYLYQFVTLFVLYKIINIVKHPSWIINDYSFAFIWTILTIALAAFSWFLFESPILRLKRYFNYDKRRESL